MVQSKIRKEISPRIRSKPKKAAQSATLKNEPISKLKWRTEGTNTNDVTTQPLGSILEAKPLHQGQKTRILGRGSQSCSHLYSTLYAAFGRLKTLNNATTTTSQCRHNRY